MSTMIKYVKIFFSVKLEIKFYKYTDESIIRKQILSRYFLSAQFLFSFIVFALFCDEYVCFDRKQLGSLVMMLQSDNQ